MDELDFGKFPKSTQAENLSQKELLERNRILEAELTRVLRELYELRSIRITDNQLRLLMQEQLEELRAAQFGVSSERYKKRDQENKPQVPAHGDPKEI